MDETVKITYSAPSNITFHGEVDTGMTKEEWAEAGQEGQAEIIDATIADLLDVGVKGE